GHVCLGRRFWDRSGGLFISRKEVEAYDCRNCACVFADGVAVSATFFAEHAPCFEVRDGVFDGCADSPDFGHPSLVSQLVLR
ncbi:hypothetical protein, partial [Pseudonocardia sp. ICBG601]|uniref:hypothetical protein n=1 Tax=Pseudonocardia sp. ICBG601 TaxID=2846759 RepID=UPI001CF6C877